MPTPNNISFESDQFKYKSRSILGQSETPKMTKFLIGKGIVKNEKQAQSILILITISFLIAAIYIFVVFVFDVQIVKPKGPTPEQVQANRERIEMIKQRRLNNQTNTQNPQ